MEDRALVHRTARVSVREADVVARSTRPSRMTSAPAPTIPPVST